MALRHVLTRARAAQFRQFSACRPVSVAPGLYGRRTFCSPKSEETPKTDAKDEPQEAKAAEPKAAAAPTGTGNILPYNLVHNPMVYNSLQYVGMIGYAHLAMGFLCHDVLLLRCLITGGSFILTNFHLWQRVPLKIPLFFSALFTSINLYFAITIFLERRVNLSEDEEKIYKKFFSARMADFEFQKLIRAGKVITAEEKQRIVTAGQQQTHLTFVIEGEVDVSIGGETHVSVTPGEFVGENAFVGKPHAARADAYAKPGCKYIYWDVAELKEKLKTDMHSQRALEVQITNALAMKLHDSAMLLSRANHDLHDRAEIVRRNSAKVKK